MDKVKNRVKTLHLAPLTEDNVDFVEQLYREIRQRAVEPADLTSGTWFSQSWSRYSTNRLDWAIYEPQQFQIERVSPRFIWTCAGERYTISKLKARKLDFFTKEDGQILLQLTLFASRYGKLVGQVTSLISRSQVNGSAKIKSLKPEELQILAKILGDGEDEIS